MAPFRFFDLPGELRNRIYLYLTKKRTIEALIKPYLTDKECLVEYDDLCELNTLLVSRQFKKEYEYEVHTKITNIEVSASRYFRVSAKHLRRLPRNPGTGAMCLSHVRLLHLHANVFYENELEKASSYLYRALPLVHALPQLKVVEQWFAVSLPLFEKLLLDRDSRRLDMFALEFNLFSELIRIHAHPHTVSIHKNLDLVNQLFSCLDPEEERYNDDFIIYRATKGSWEVLDQHLWHSFVLETVDMHRFVGLEL